MLSLVMTIVASSTDGTSSLPLSVRLLGDVGRCLALGQRHGQLGRGLGDPLDRLVDGHQLLAGQDPLDRRQLGVLAGDGLLAGRCPRP